MPVVCEGEGVVFIRADRVVVIQVDQIRGSTGRTNISVAVIVTEFHIGQAGGELFGQSHIGAVVSGVFGKIDVKNKDDAGENGGGIEGMSLSVSRVRPVHKSTGQIGLLGVQSAENNGVCRACRIVSQIGTVDQIIAVREV